jgi:hypothetical protein
MEAEGRAQYPPLTSPRAIAENYSEIIFQEKFLLVCCFSLHPSPASTISSYQSIESILRILFKKK